MPIQAVVNNPPTLPSKTVDRPAPEVRADPAPAAAIAPAAQVDVAVQRANQLIRQMAQDLEFSVDEGSGRTITRLVDKESNTVIRQFPSEDMLSIARALDHFQGVLLKLKA